jgi:hypothetical protein
LEIKTVCNSTFNFTHPCITQWACEKEAIVLSMASFSPSHSYLIFDISCLSIMYQLPGFAHSVCDLWRKQSSVRFDISYFHLRFITIGFEMSLVLVLGLETIGLVWNMLQIFLLTG